MVDLTVNPDDHRACEMRYRDLLDRLRGLAERLDQIERDQRAIVEILRDFRGLVGLMATWLKTLDHQVEKVAAFEKVAARLIPLPAPERIARHFRN